MKNIPASMQHSQKFIVALHWLLPLGRMTREYTRQTVVITTVFRIRFDPPGSGSCHKQAKKLRKTMISNEEKSMIRIRNSLYGSMDPDP